MLHRSSPRRGAVAVAALAFILIGYRPGPGTAAQAYDPTIGVSGSIRDASGAAIPGTAFLLQPSTRSVEDESPNDDDGFSFPPVWPGQYTFRFESAFPARRSRLRWMLPTTSTPAGTPRISERTSGPTRFPGRLRSLVNGKTYTVTVVAKHANGPGRSSAPLTVTLDRDEPAPTTTTTNPAAGAGSVLRAVDIEPTPSGRGYRILESRGRPWPRRPAGATTWSPGKRRFGG